MAKPTDFFLGITDLFSIVLPGASITYVGMKVEEHFGQDLLGLLKLSHTNEGYIAFFAMSYLVGHGIDLVGGILLDPLYDLTFAHWKRCRDKSLRCWWRWWLELPKRLVKEIRRGLGHDVPPADPGSDSLLERARELSASDIPKNDRVYQWSRAWVVLQNPLAWSEIERLQANSKFLRGMVTAFLLTGLLSVAVSTPFKTAGGAVCWGLALLAFIRYGDLRWKAVQSTYRFFIALRAQGSAESSDAVSAGAESV